jgi:hypothetical protein
VLVLVVGTNDYEVLRLAFRTRKSVNSLNLRTKELTPTLRALLTNVICGLGAEIAG